VEPKANVDGGTRYLRHLLTLFDGDLRLALAGYNAGEGSVIAAGRRVPRFQETQRYVPAVLDRMQHWRRVLKELSNERDHSPQITRRGSTARHGADAGGVRHTRLAAPAAAVAPPVPETALVLLPVRFVQPPVPTRRRH